MVYNWNETVDIICQKFNFASYSSELDEIICDTREQSNIIAEEVNNLMGIEDCLTSCIDEEEKDGKGNWEVYVV